MSPCSPFAYCSEPRTIWRVSIARSLAASLRALQWLGESFTRIKPEPLTGNLAGLFKLRTGDYRIIYEPLREERVLVVHAIGHRRDIYRGC